MLKKLTVHDHEQVVTFLQQEASFNLFILGDIEAFGYDSPFQELWGEFSKDNSLRAVLLRYYNSFIPYAVDSFSVEAFAEKMRDYKNITLSGKTKLVEKFEGIADLQLGRRQRTYFCECKATDDTKRVVSSEMQVKQATIADVDRILELRRQIKEFSIMDNARDMLLQTFKAQTGRTYYIEEEGKMVACASTTAETSSSAMVVGVCTHSGARNKGYASSILARMIADVAEENKSLCLFYDNPAAGRIYKKLGFRDLGMWTMYREG